MVREVSGWWMVDGRWTLVDGKWIALAASRVIPTTNDQRPTSNNHPLLADRTEGAADELGSLEAGSLGIDELGAVDVEYREHNDALAAGRDNLGDVLAEERGPGSDATFFFNDPAATEKAGLAALGRQ